MANPKPEAKPEAKTDEPKEKAPKKPVAPPVMPSIEKLKLTDEGKSQYQAVMENTQSMLKAVEDAKSVPIDVLRLVRRASFYGYNQRLKGFKPDPEEKKKERLLKQIAKAQAALKELGIE